MWKYLKDQGGQFWGAFGKSYAEALEKSRDRPLKEAMLKAQVGHQQALQKKMEMDVQQEVQQQAAMNELTGLLTTKQPTEVPTKIGGPVQGPATEAGEPPAPPPLTTTEMKNVEMTDPRVKAALLKSGVKGEVLSQAARQAFPTGATTGTVGGAIVNSWEEATHLSNDPAFKAANPYGGRWIVNSKGQIQFQGIHPVNPEAAIFHGPGGAQGAQNYAYNRSAATGAGGFAGRTAQEAEQPIQPMQPLPGQPTAPIVQGATPGYAGPMPAPSQPTGGSRQKPGETQAQFVQRSRKEAQTAGSPLPEGLAKQQRDYTTLLNTTIADIETNLDPAFLGARGLPGVQALRENEMSGAFLEKMGIVNKPSEKEVIFRSALADASDMLLRVRSGAQINEQEAKRLEKLLPKADSDEKTFRAKLARFKHQVQMSISNGKLFANVTRSQLEGMGEGQPSPTPLSGKQPSGDWEFTGK